MQTSHILNGKYVCKEKLGEGAFGTVYKVVNQKTQEFQALKIILVPKDSNYLRRTLREILLLKHLKHEHLILLEDAFMYYQNENIFIGFVTQLMKMNMRKMLETYSMSMTEKHIKFFMYQLFLGLDYLHFNGILHRDLKPDNILVNNLNHLQIADFGWARVMPRDEADFTRVFANIHYRAPEICLQVDHIGPPVDIWAVGCIFFEVLECGANLFQSRQSADLVEEIVKKFGSPSTDDLGFLDNLGMIQFIQKVGKFPKTRPSQYLKLPLDPAGMDLLDQCLHFDPNKRISTSAALKHPYFAELFEANVVEAGLRSDAGQIDFSFEEVPHSNDKVYLLQRIVSELNYFKANS